MTDAEQGDAGTAPSERTYILHVLWFTRPHGARRYQQYLEAASPIAEKYGARRVEAVVPIEVIQGDFKPDYMFLVEWPSMEHFDRFRADPAYRAAAQFRDGACEKHCLVQCKVPTLWMHTHGEF